MTRDDGAALDLRGHRGWLWVAGCLILLLTGWILMAPALLGEDGYMPHGHCYLWQPPLIALHLVSDAAIGISYFAISATLVYLVVQTREQLPFNWMVVAFGVFIIACGATHLMEVYTLWTPAYWVAGDVKLLTAIASAGTAIALPPLVPRIRQLLSAEETVALKDAQLSRQESLLAQEQEARTRAEEADRAKDQFLAMVSHELRTPLSPILAWSKMLLMGSLDAERQHAAVEAIVRNAMAQAQLVDDLLDVSRIVTGKLRLDVRPTDLAQVVDAAVASVRPSAEAKQIRIHTVLDTRAGSVLGDPDRLQQVMWNLLSNAIKFTPKSGRVQVALRRVNSHIEISVADTGLGIEPSVLPRVFERFWQAEGGATRRGMGLGLAIVRHIVELHGGEVRAHSEGAGQGATFIVQLPIMAMTEPVHERTRRHPVARPDEVVVPTLPSLAGIRALVVDDDPDSNEMVHTLLASCGAEVRVAASAGQALELLDRWHADVLISDIEMPDGDGYALIAGVRRRPPERGGRIPAIALTAFARVEDRVRILTAGFQLHVGKPVDPAELAAAVLTQVREAVAAHGQPR